MKPKGVGEHILFQGEDLRSYVMIISGGVFKFKMRIIFIIKNLIKGVYNGRGEER